MLEHWEVTGDDWETSPDVDEVNGDARGAPVWGPEEPAAPEAIAALWLWILQTSRIVGGPGLPPRL